MKIKRITLKNIRSYDNLELKFPDGVTMFSGDVGSGKSTILLAMEFALFGIQRGEVSGSALLRHGKDSGYVILDFEVDDKQVSIKRTLKRTSANILQDSGFITINDLTQQLTPTELKQKVIEILNYPQEILSKKSMVYRYTVYTLQEEMKTILVSDKESRLETLRKVFNIDKYKRVDNNCRIIISELRAKKREFAASIHDLEEKKDKLSKSKERINEIKEKILTVESQISNINNSIAVSKDEISIIENELVKLNDLRKEFDLLSLNIRLKSESKIKNKSDHDSLLSEINTLSGNILNEENIVDIKKQIEETNLAIKLKEDYIKEILKRYSEIKSMHKHSENIKERISSIDKCPLCEQVVSAIHKQSIILREEKAMVELLSEIESYLKKEKITENEIEDAKKDIEILRQRERDSEMNKLKSENFKSKRILLEKIASELSIIEKEIHELNNKKADLSLSLDSMKGVEEKFPVLKSNLEKQKDELKNHEIDKARLQQELDSLEFVVSSLGKEVEDKIKIREKLESYIKISEWLENYFINLVGLIERNVMARVHHDFADLFQKWFSMLIDSENICVRLDEEFTPLIEQNGYDTEYENLSGGERTACALSYRLALNQVINNINSNIKTRDLIILDEPTDGFSSEQLDRLRNVLRELKMKQIIIVSHESKIESFADNIIKIRKEGHSSSILS